MDIRFNEKWENIGLANDFLFGKVMSNPKLCKKLLELIIPEMRIERIEYPELQKSIKEDADARSVRLDVYVKDDKETVYNIEMQTTSAGELPKRSRYYQGMIDLQLLDKNESYKKLNKSYIIFICMNDIFGYGRHKYTFENRCKEERNLPLGDETTKIFLNTNGISNDVGAKLKAVLDYIAGRENNDSFVLELKRAVTEAKRNREWRREYMTLFMRDQENIELGMKKGMDIGLNIGIKGMVSALRKLKQSDDIILQNIKDEYGLNEEEAKKYL